MDIQRVRNLTTGRLHTKMTDIYQDIEYLTGAEGVMTHQLPNAVNALTPYLNQIVKDPKFWDGEYDTNHTGDIEIPKMNDSERSEFFKRYEKLPSIFG